MPIVITDNHKKTETTKYVGRVVERSQRAGVWVNAGYLKNVEPFNG